MTIAEKITLMKTSFDDIRAAISEKSGEDVSASKRYAKSVYELYGGEEHTPLYVYPSSGTLVDKIKYFKNIKSEIKDAITYQGVSVSDVLSEYGDAIRGIGRINVVSYTLPEGVAYQPYSAQIQALSGGTSEGLTFEYYSGAMPAEFTLSSDGVLSGTPTENKSYKALRIKITHTESGEYVIAKFSIRIAQREVNANVTVNGVSDKNAHFTYAPDMSFTVSVTFTDSASGDTVDVTSYEYSVNSTYYTSSETTTFSGLNNCGWYGIEVYNPDGCTVANQNGVNNIVIDQCPVTVTVEDLTVTYGEDYEMTVAFDVEYDVPYTIEYRASGGEYTETKPTDAGTYTVRVTVDSSNYSAEIAYATLTIEES